ncbi:MAG TPA: ATP-binding protein [Nocardioides sp.]|nr:ATP-binding protein [Nocardioides sp.]
MPNPGRDQISWPAAGLILLGVLATGVVAVEFAPAGSPAASWWPAAGLAVVLLGLTPRSWWWSLVPGIVVMSVVANVVGDRPPTLSCCYAVANAAEAVVAASVLRHGGRRTLPELSSVEELVRLLVAAVLGGLTIATIAAGAAAALDDGSFGLTWRAVFASHAASVLVILPLVMTPVTAGPRRAAWELPLQIGVLVAVTAVVFSPDQTLTLEFIPLPLLIWGALRFDVRLVAWEVFGFAVVVTILSSRGYGTFAFDHERGELSAFGMGAIVQAYVVVAVLMTLPLAIGVEQRRGTERLFRRNFTESVVGMLLMRGGRGRPFEITDMNDAAARLLPDDTRGRSLGEVLDTSEPLDLVAARLLAGQLDGWRSQVGVRGRPCTRVEVVVSLLASEPTPTYAAQLVDVTTESEARRRLEAAEKLTSATLDTTAAIILVTDLYGEVVRVNGATTALTGFTEDELVGTEIWDIPFAPPGSEGYPAGLPEEVDAQVSRETDVTTRSGERRRVLWNTSYVRDERDRPTHVVLTGTDLTAERTVAGLNRHLLEAAITTALIGIDPHGRITVFNAGAVNLLGYDAQDTVGTPFVDLLDPAELAQRCGGATAEEAFAALVAGIEEGGETGARDWTWIGADGRRHTVSMTLSVAADRIAARVGYLCVGRDVTEARASQEMLIAALEKERLAVQRMRDVDAAKNEFVSTVSHELRTPVTSIVGYTEILEDGTLVEPAAEQRPLLESIGRNGRRLIMLCDDLLTLGGLDSGATRWERGAVDLTSILPNAEDAVRAQLTRRELTLDVVAPTEPVLVVGDGVQLERALTNLLSNAIKFTESGGRITVTVEARDGEAHLAVSDTGIGIPLEEQERLFQRFFRSSTAQERAIQGTGLGLSIVNAIVSAHGGRIDVRSAHLEGTTFTVRLPLAR